MTLARMKAGVFTALLFMGVSNSSAYQIIDNFPTSTGQVTSVDDYVGADVGYMRHEYAKRPAFNADDSYALMLSSNGYLHLYAVNADDTLSYVRILDQVSAGGNVEPNWHPSDPNLLYSFNPHGVGMKLHLTDVRDQSSVAVIDLLDDVQALGGSFATASAAYTGQEGRPSRDGNIWCMAVYGSDTNDVRGLIAYDLAADQIVAHEELDLGINAVSTAVSGNYCIAFGELEQDADGNYFSLGIRSYPITDNGFGAYRQLHNGPEHADVAIDADGRDVLVYVDFINDGSLKAVDLESGRVVNFFTLWDGPSPTNPAGVHFAGMGYDQPGWAVVSLFYGNQSHFHYNKVMAIELAENPRIVMLADNQHPGVITPNDPFEYWFQPHAVTNEALDKVLFARFADGTVTSQMVTLNLALPVARSIMEGNDTPGDGGDSGGGDPGGAALVISADETVYFQEEGNLEVGITTNTAASCRWDYADGTGNTYPYAALYQDMSSSDGLSHTLSEYAAFDHDLYIVCQSASAEETDVLIQVRQGVPPTLSIISSDQLYFQEAGDITVNVETSLAAECRWDYSDGNSYPYVVLYQDAASTDGLHHDFSEYAFADHDLYVVCREVGGTTEVEQVIQVRQGEEPEPPTPQSLTVSTNTTVFFDQEGILTYTVETNQAAQCRWDYADGTDYPFVVLFQNLATTDNLSHSFSEYVAFDHGLYVVCRSNVDNTEVSQTIQVNQVQ